MAPRPLSPTFYSISITTVYEMWRDLTPGIMFKKETEMPFVFLSVMILSDQSSDSDLEFSGKSPRNYGW